MKFFLVFSLAFFCLEAVAEGPYYVQPMEEGLNMKAFEGKNITVLPPAKPAPYHSHLPSVEQRELVFFKSGLAESVREMEEIEKDSLYVELSQTDSAAIGRAMARYPQLGAKEKELRAAQSLITTAGEK